MKWIKWLVMVMLVVGAPTKALAQYRGWADVASWSTLATTVALDTKASWDSDNRVRAFTLQGVRLGLQGGIVALTKHFVKSDRPCSPDCGLDHPDASFFSGHTTMAFTTLGGPRLAFSIPLTVGTGGLRMVARKHRLLDVVVGAGVGSLISRIR